MSHNDADKSPFVVEITGIPQQVTKDELEMYLENNRRSGGGPVENIDYDSAAGSAWVTFQNDAGKSFS
jgi:hypothetical protein